MSSELRLRLVLTGAFVALSACEPKTFVEAPPPLEGCAFDDGLFFLPQGPDLDAELGQLDGGAFVPLEDDAELEMAPWPWFVREWYVLLRARMPGDALAGERVCARVQLALVPDPEVVPDPNLGINGTPVPFARQPDGSYVSAPFAVAVGSHQEGLTRFDPRAPQPVTLGPALGFIPAGGRLSDVWVPRTTIRPVNHVGFLSARDGGEVDAGSSTGPGLLDIGLPGLVTVRPGEDVPFGISITSSQPREAVTLTIDPLPAGVTLTLPQATLDAATSQVTGRLSVAASVAPATIPLKVTATGATSSGVREHFLNVVAATEREVAVAAFPSATRAPLGEEVLVDVHLAPLGGFSGAVSLVAEAPPGVDVTFPAMPLSLAAPMNVSVRVRQEGQEASAVRLHAVAGRDAWSSPLGLVALEAPLPPVRSQVVLLPGFSERRVVAPGESLGWTVRTWGLQPGGEMQRSRLAVSGGPAGCSVRAPDAGAPVSQVLEVSCDAGAAGGAETVTVTATTPSASVTEAWRVVVPGPRPGLEAFGVAPEARPQSLDGEWPRLAGLRNDRFLLAMESNDFGFATVGYDGGFPAAPADGVGDGVRVVTVGQAASLRALTLTRLQGRFFLMGSMVGGPTNARGPFDAVGHWNGSVWAATGVGNRVWVGHHDGTNWVDDGAALPDLPGLTDVALAVQNQATVLVTAEPQVVVRRLQAGTWATLPAFPVQLVAPAKTARTTGRAVLGVALDAAAQPVVALITDGGELQVHRLEGSAWVRLGGLTGTPGLLPLSLSMAVNPLSADPNLRLTLVVHEATQALAVSSGRRVLPAHAAQSKLRLFRLGAGGFTELDTPGVDPAQGMPEQPHVTFDGDGRPYVSFVENGRVFVQRAAP